jgi:predicted AAA+ superfamily ATPase
MHINRQIKDQIIDQVRSSRKIIVIYGARQTGKTTLVNEIISELGLKTLSVDGDQFKYINVLSSRDFNKLNALVEGYDLLFIDEAQHIPEIGINLKILYDKKPDLRIIVTGSSSLNIASEVSESLTGRKFTFKLHPVSVNELRGKLNEFEIRDKLEELMVFGSYPEVLTTVNAQQKIKLLEEIGHSYLYKDLFELAGIRQKNKLRELLRLISFQIGYEVSVHELSRILSLSRPSIENYLNLLEESFIIFHLSAFSRNLRKEISKMNKYYFYDTGIRNLLINNFNPLTHRNDSGQLWENLIITQKIIQSGYDSLPSTSWFWRIYTGAEIDYIEERAGKLTGYEIKYNKTTVKPPKTWVETYDAGFNLINKDNFLDYI